MKIWTANNIDDEGARKIWRSLKTNTTWSHNIDSTGSVLWWKKWKWKCIRKRSNFPMIKWEIWKHNNIGKSGKRAVRRALKSRSSIMHHWEFSFFHAPFKNRSSKYALFPFTKEPNQRTSLQQRVLESFILCACSFHSVCWRCPIRGTWWEKQCVPTCDNQTAGCSVAAYQLTRFWAFFFFRHDEGLLLFFSDLSSEKETRRKNKERFYFR